MENTKTTTEKTYILFSNVEKDFYCDYVQQTAKILSKKNYVIVVFYTRPHALGFLLRNSYKILEILSSWKKIIFESKPDIYNCEFVSLIPFQRLGLVYNLNKLITRWELSLLLFLRKLYIRKTSKIILWLYHPTAEFFISKMNEEVSLYDCVDYLRRIPLEEKIGEMEKRLLINVDYVFTNSSILSNLHNQIRKDIQVVPCGCDIDSFPQDYHPKSIPDELKKIKKPIIGLIGHIDYRLNTQLLSYLFGNNKDYTFVLIGKILTENIFDNNITEAFLKFLESLKKYPNVFIITPKEKAQLKDYLYYFDIALIPYDLKYPEVYYANPMKFYEYMAMGLPVVSSIIPALLKYKLPTIKFAKNHQEHDLALKYLLNHPRLKNRYKTQARKIAQENSWEKKVGMIINAIKF